MNTITLYSTQTGNTKKVAETIFKINPFEKAIIPIAQLEGQVSLDDYDLILIGYWVENSQASGEALSIMEQLRNKQVILFGTSGTDPNHSYVRKVRKAAESALDPSNELLGHFVCQGEISEAVIAGFEALVNMQPENEAMANLLRVFKEQFPISIGHPNEEDLRNAEQYFHDIFSLIGSQQ